MSNRGNLRRFYLVLLSLNSFTYTLTFAGFGSPYITIAATDP